LKFESNPESDLLRSYTYQHFREEKKIRGVAIINSGGKGWVGAKPVPEIIDPVFAKTSQNARFLLSENERFGLVFVKTGSINSGTGKDKRKNENLPLITKFTLR
jgi:hypothetical protein